MSAVALTLYACSDDDRKTSDTSGSGRSSASDASDFTEFCDEARSIAKANSEPTTDNLLVRLRTQMQQLVHAAPSSYQAELRPLLDYDSSDGGNERNPGQVEARPLIIRLLEENCQLGVEIFETR